MTITIDTHDVPPPADAAVVDTGLGDANDIAAPLHEVRPLGCFARDEAGAVIGGAVGRTWGDCCELQQLWVAPAWQKQGIASRLVQAFEAHAGTRGCRHFYLETYSFQAVGFYRKMGYATDHELDVYPHGITKHLMRKDLV
jgi:GNAT superfamily N-acetyltransferase